MIFRKIVVILIAIGLLLSIFGKIALIILGIIILLYIIRKCADIFWWGKGKGKW